MQCTKPIWITVASKKGSGRILESVQVPCGKCMSCRIAYAREWSMRLMNESEFHDHSTFITLTYNPTCVPKNGSLDKTHFQLFMKRLRKHLEPQKIKYFAAGEYGDEGRPHYHAIIFGLNLASLDTFIAGRSKGQNIIASHVLERLWPYGFNSVGTVTYDSCRYVADYIQKKYSGKLEYETYKSKGLETPFKLASNGIGERFALENADYIRENLGMTMRGTQQGLPRYYRKVLGITQEQIAEKAKEKSAEYLETLDKKSKKLGYTPGEVDFSLRKNRDLTARGMSKLVKKGNL